MKTKHSNRRSRQAPKKSRGWCGGCDACWVVDGVKCPVCGHNNGDKRRFKKSSPTIEEFLT